MPMSPAAVWKLFAAAAVGIALAIAHPLSAQTVLVEDGKPAAVIVIAAEATRQEQLAAQELQSHVALMSGATLPIVKGDAARSGDSGDSGDSGTSGGVPIYIGSAAPSPELERLAAAGTDEATLRVHVTPEMIQLVGNSDTGTIYATYELLEQLGVRWFFPGELGVDVPGQPTVVVRHQDLIDAPAFRGRHLQAIGDADWARRMRLSGLNAGAHGLGPKFDREKEPHLFYHENGKPTQQEKVSEPEVLRRVIEHWRANLAANPDLDYINVGPHDGAGFGSDPWDADDFDPFMGAVGTTDRYVKFFNLILEDLQKDYPNVGLAFYAYTQEMRPPVREKPNPKIMPVLAAINLDRFHSIHNPLSWEKRYLKKVIEGWQALGVNMMFRGYLFNLADQGLPFSMIHIVRDEWPYYHDKGFIAMRVQCIPNWAYDTPALYVAARMYWNPYLDVDALLAEYFERMYGPAAGAMQRHVSIIEDAYKHGDYFTGNVFDVPKILTPQVREQMAATLAEAEKAAGTGNRYADRVRMVRIGFDYGMANLAMMEAFWRGDFIEAKAQHDRIENELIPTAIAHDPPIITPRLHVSYFKRFWSTNVTMAHERVTGGNEVVAMLPDEWRIMLDPYGVGEELELFNPELGTQSWQPIRTWSESTSNQGLRYYKWTAWYRCTVTLPDDDAFAGRKLRFWMGGVDDTPKVWINGRELPQLLRGAAPTGKPWEFDATDAVKFGQDNVVVVKVSDNAVNELGTFGINGPVMIWAQARP